MANKALAKRQKLSFRVEPSQKAQRVLKPRNPVALPARQRSAAGPHVKTASTARQGHKRNLKKILGEPES